MIRIIIDLCPCVSRDVENLGFGVLRIDITNSKRGSIEICQLGCIMVILRILMLTKNTTVVTRK